MDQALKPLYVDLCRRHKDDPDFKERCQKGLDNIKENDPERYEKVVKEIERIVEQNK
jgi:hypothetical protein